MKSIFIILLNWNNGEDTEECLHSLRRFLPPSYRIIVVDNGSSDGSAEKLPRKFPEDQFIFNGKNLGFAEGNNVGIRSALSQGADYLVLLNNDTVARNDFVGRLIETAERDERIGIVGAKIKYFDSADRIWFAGGSISLWRGTAYHCGLNRVDDSKRYAGIQDASFVTGCLMLIRREVFQSIGFFDKCYFAYLEDLDLCYRAAQAGWKLKVDLDCEILHKVGNSQRKSTSLSPSEIYYATRNRLYFADKHLSPTRKISFYLYFFSNRLIRILQWELAGKKDLSKAAMEGLRDSKRRQWGAKTRSDL